MSTTISWSYSCACLFYLNNLFWWKTRSDRMKSTRISARSWTILLMMLLWRLFISIFGMRRQTIFRETCIGWSIKRISSIIIFSLMIIIFLWILSILLYGLMSPWMNYLSGMIMFSVAIWSDLLITRYWIIIFYIILLLITVNQTFIF